MVIPFVSIKLLTTYLERHCKWHLGMENRAQSVISSPDFKHFSIQKIHVELLRPGSEDPD